jgi:ubiquinone/menaquinone biosynthesis C-methylase UbiE
MTGKPVSTAEWYDFISAASDLAPEIHVGGMEATRELLQLVTIDAASRVLDVGCGAGHTACYIAQRYGARVTGFDLSEAMLTLARRRASQEGLAHLTEFRQGDIRSMPFADGQFDLALFQSVLTVFPGDPAEALREIVRVVRPGGHVAANEGTISEDTPPELLLILQRHPALYNLFTPASLQALFTAAGLEITTFRPIDHRDGQIVSYRPGLGPLLKFMLLGYPRVAWKLLTNKRLREAHHIDDQMTSRARGYMSYALIVARKPA